MQTIERGGACVTALMIHGLYQRPLVGLGKVTFCCVLSVMAVKAPHSVYMPVKNRCAHVTSRGIKFIDKLFFSVTN